MLELTISEKDISRNPFGIISWAGHELTMSLFATKPVRKGQPDKQPPA